MSNLDLSQALDTAVKASQLGRKVLLEYYGRLKKVQEKFQAGLVSEADVESEKVISAELARGLPGVDILGEEHAYLTHEESLKPNIWAVDPLDGTTNYVHQFPIFCISIGLQWEGELAVGVVDVPLLNRTYTCAKGRGAFVNGQKISVSQRHTIKESLLATGFIATDTGKLKDQLRIFSDLVHEARGIRRAGAAAYDLCLVAEGVFDAFWEPQLKPWDTAAGTLMVREAGGVALNYSGQPYSLGDDSLLCGNPTVTPLIRERIVPKSKG